jgi:hypothetical protein
MDNHLNASIETLQAEKTAARQELLKHVPSDAQWQVNQTLHAESWKAEIETPWIERLQRTNDATSEWLTDDSADT